VVDDSRPDGPSWPSQPSISERMPAPNPRGPGSAGLVRMRWPDAALHIRCRGDRQYDEIEPEAGFVGRLVWNGHSQRRESASGPKKNGCQRPRLTWPRPFGHGRAGAVVRGSPAVGSSEVAGDDQGWFRENGSIVAVEPAGHQEHVVIT